MPGFEKVRKNLEAHGFDVTCFDTAAEAADYLDRRLDGKTVGHGGSITLKELGLLERLQSHAAEKGKHSGVGFAPLHWPLGHPVFFMTGPRITEVSLSGST